MVPWNSFPLEVSYQVLGWLAFLSWGVAGYPQLILNFRRKSVVGLSLDFQILSLTKHCSYLIYNASLFFSPLVQKQYFEKYGYEQMIPVAANDVAFSSHAVRGNQKFSIYTIAIAVAVWFTAGVCFFIALPTQSWLWLVSIFNIIQAIMTLIKYFPQTLLNFLRKSTNGFSIGTVLLDFSGGVFNYSQMAVQSIDQGSWVNFYGNIGKVLISLVTISYDSILICQHYVLYPDNKKGLPSKNSEEIKQSLICASPSPIDQQQIKGSVTSSYQSPPEV
ncbi:cystinosin homolog isoform X2 [Vigna unguiculata]|uniref:cystinosin homolog isoform X2 n=1 Tax=Vigna unguiculata TaxID=3917 RepID=UPI0010160A42|nr:cystinosin homolog isoform X2 [Vigna unguiculata]